MVLLLLPEQNISLEQLKARRICFSSQFHGREAQQPGYVTGAETCGLTSSILVDLEARFEAGTEPCYHPLAPTLCSPARSSVEKLTQLL